MDFESAQEYLKSFVSYGDLPRFDYNEETFNLKRFKSFVEDMGINYSKLKYIHVAGSKGKGTVSTLIAEYLKRSGHKTGLFTSPYMIDIRESFWVNGDYITKRKFINYVKDVKKYYAESGKKKVTYFEILTALVLKYFVEEGVEYAVLEAGLGGRLDSTNIVIPIISVLSSIEKEHTDVLGDTLSKILDEKLGIVKKSVPLIVGYQTKKVKSLIIDKLKGRKDVYFVDEKKEDLKLDDFSSAKVRNGILAYFTLKHLFGEVDESVFIDVFKSLFLIGRFDVRIFRRKIVVFDIAHTVSSIKNMISALVSKFPDKEFVFLVSIMRGKNVRGIFSNIESFSKRIILTSSHEGRGFKGRDLQGFIKSREATVIEDPIIAYNRALLKLKKNQILVVTGSHFLVGLILKKIAKN